MFLLKRSYDSLSPLRKRLWRATRWIFPSKTRFFYQGCPQIRGQLWYAERKLLYETAATVRPAVAFEVGTWLGGGSTFFIAQALHDTSKGKLHTIEVDPNLHASAIASYKAHAPQLLDIVSFHLGNSVAVYTPLLALVEKVDLLFLDGAEDADGTISEFHLFEPFLKEGSVLVCHDWGTDKMRKLRGILEGSESWKEKARLGPPDSVGMAVFVLHSN